MRATLFAQIALHEEIVIAKQIKIFSRVVGAIEAKEAATVVAAGWVGILF